MEVARRCRFKQRLAPVLEHYEAPESAEDPVLELHDPCCSSSESSRACCHHVQQQKKASKSSSSCMRILSRLRDAYVKLMNDIASGADFTGVASFYGCPAATHDYSSVFMVGKSSTSRPQGEIGGDLAHPCQFISYFS